jgi:putative flippase GtrA
MMFVLYFFLTIAIAAAVAIALGVIASLLGASQFTHTHRSDEDLH